jgi:hypothetical protein
MIRTHFVSPLILQSFASDVAGLNNDSSVKLGNAVIDGLVFVFGTRAQQKTRLKKLSDLIHCSPALPACASCTVSVSFCLVVDRVSMRSPVFWRSLSTRLDFA